MQKSLTLMFALILSLTGIALTACDAWSQPPSPAADADASAPLTLDFPRLGMWWPDPDAQALDDIARYDWVILWDDAGRYIPDLRARHPDILLLNATNACELIYAPGDDLEPWGERLNDEIRRIPAEWFLTQVGTELTQAADATATTLHVAAITVTDGSKVYELFVPGDTALIGDESVYVEAVNAAAKTLTVQRGYIRPAAAHDAGTRIAAHIAFWPESWLLNASTLSPEGVISPTIGSEIWPEYNARRAAALVQTANWDGILLDRSDADESWLIGSSTARTIDPDQSNTLLTDYSAFDAAWNAGIRRYEQLLRDAIGPEKIIFVNWGMANYDLLNGNNFEAFPLDNGGSYSMSWRQTVFGPADQGSYFAWMAQARDPTLTMIETYEDDAGADPTGDGGYDNPCADPGFEPNYRKMRFGLTTALLNDGFFSYEINTNGHGSLCLLWFDEYDNAGAGRGYLGQPLGPAQRALPALTTPNLVGDGTFESEVDSWGWELWAYEGDGYAATVARDTTTSTEGAASARVDVTQSQGVDWKVEFSPEAPIEIISGTEYTLSFWAKADADDPMHVIAATVQQAQDPWESYIAWDDIALSADWQHFELSGVASGADAAAVLHFAVGARVGAVWFDDVRLQQGNRDVWRRDYAGGVALVNATASEQTISLGGTFHKIAGTQAPEINDGSLVTEVTLPFHDGIVLLRLPRRIYLPVVLRR